MTRRQLTHHAALVLTLLALAAGPARAAEIRPVRTAPADAAMELVAFGSCAHQGRPQPIWDAVLAARPDLFLFLGDNVYADSEDPERIAGSYRIWERDHEGFRKLRARVPILATWDDHDYGVNDGGADFPAKEASRRIFLDFFGEPPGSPRRQSPGVHDARVFGPPGRRIQVILLDTRSFRSPLRVGERERNRALGRPGAYDPNPDPSATILGRDQWAWLERQLVEPAELRLVVSSIQVLAEDHRWERWASFPLERQRLFERIAASCASGVIFLSGDRHDGEISILPAAGRVDGLGGERTENPVGYPLIDVTSSSLNAGRPWENEVNRHRLGAMYFGSNFGTVAVDWAAEPPAVTLAIRDEDGQAVIEHRLTLDTLRASAPSCNARSASSP